MINRFPSSSYLLPNEANQDNIKNNYDFIFLNNNQVSFLNLNTFDLAFNTMSFQEMSNGSIKLYFNLLRRILKKDNIFYCLNAVEKEMITNEIIEKIRFSEYPWKDDDLIFDYSLSDVHKNKTTKPFFRKIVQLTKK